jgi:hypothetical protein
VLRLPGPPATVTCRWHSVRWGALQDSANQDERSDAAQLAALLPNARFVRVPGDHASAFAAPELTTAILTFLAGR